METIKKAYSEILDLLNKHKDICIFDVDSLKMKADFHLLGVELKEKYGFDIDPKRVQSLEWIKFGEYTSVGLYGEKNRRTISWSIDDRQPEDEYLFEISFSTGAYIFGGDYPTEFFRKFWLELKSFNPDYTDEVNSSLYWKLGNAKSIFNSFNSILKKYSDLNAEDFKQRKIKKMESDLEQLKKS